MTEARRAHIPWWKREPMIFFYGIVAAVIIGGSVGVVLIMVFMQ